MSISLGTSSGPENLQYLLNLQLYSSGSNSMQKARHNKEKVVTADYVQDTFFNYSFSYPKITPRHHKFLALLPGSWKAMDEDLKNNHRSGDLGKWVQRVKYRLSRHYYRNSAKQLAQLEKSNLLWASLQDDLTRYALVKPTESEDIFISEGTLRKMIKVYHPQGSPNGKGSPLKQKSNLNMEEDSALVGRTDASENQTSEPNIVSYLFNRDKWEFGDEWRPYHSKLSELCHQGIPSQLRKIVWSELGRVCYFIELSEVFLTQEESQKMSDNADRIEGYSNGKQTKSQKIYEKLKHHALKEYYYLYQELEEDIDTLREKQGVDKLDYQTNLRNICKTFIYWSHLFANVPNEEVRYFVSYSRALLTICQSLIIALSCSYLQGELYVEEDVVFWLLISLTTYILQSYYETNENALSVEVLTGSTGKAKARRNNKITTSALRCPEIKGLKGDLVLLKLLLKDLEPEIFHKFEELGLPVEEFFADNMLTLFSVMFSPAMTYRIWDLIFFEGSASNQVRSHRTIVVVLFTVIRNCKSLILAAKTYREVKFSLDLYCKFMVDYDSFLNQVQKSISEHFEQQVPASETLLEKLSFIKFAFFSKEFNKFDNRIRDCEHRIHNYHTSIFEQNKIIHGLVNTHYRHLNIENNSLTYATISEMINTFINTYSTPKLASSFIKSDDPGNSISQNASPTRESKSQKGKLFTNVYMDEKGVQKNKFSHIQLIIHRLTLYWPELESLSLRVSFDRDHFDKSNLTSLNVNYPVEFVVGNQDQLQRRLFIEIYDTKNPNNPKKIKWLAIDLKVVECDILTKSIVKFNEEGQDTNNDNFTTSEVEFSILLVGMPKEDGKKGDHQASNFVIPELENEDYHVFKNLNLGSSVQKLTKEFDNIMTIEPNQNHISLRSKYTWKNHFAMNFEEFLEVMKKIAPFWSGIVDFGKIFNAVLRSGSDQTFYFNDFIILLVLFGKFSFRQKMNLLFKVHAAFNDIFKGQKHDEVSVSTIKGIASYMYEAFMVYIPNNEIENMVDDLVSDSNSVILKVVINSDTDRKVVLQPAVLNRLANYMHLHHFTKDIYIADPDVLNYLRSACLKEIKKANENNDITLLEKNKLEVHYTNNGMRHKFKIEFDNEWRALAESNEIAPNSMKTSLQILYNNKSVIPMNHHDQLLNEHDFTKVFEFLPMIDYLCGFENIRVPQPISEKTRINYVVSIEDDPVLNLNLVSSLSQEDHQLGMVSRSQISTTGVKQDKSRTFRNILKEWIQLVSNPNLMQEVIKQNSQNQNNNSKNQARDMNNNNEKIIKLNKTQEKVSIYFPLRKLVSQIKRYLIKDLDKRLNSRTSASRNLNINPKFLNENLYDLDFEVSVVVNRNKKSKIITNLDLSVYESLYEIEGAFNEGAITDIETRINLKDTTSLKKRIHTNIFNQLALYRYADASTEWLPCRVVSKIIPSDKFDRANDRANLSNVEGFGVEFENFPHEIMIKRRNEVALIHALDFLEIGSKVIQEDSHKVVKQPSRENQEDKKQGILGKKFSKGLEHFVETEIQQIQEEDEEHRRDTGLVKKTK